MPQTEEMSGPGATRRPEEDYPADEDDYSRSRSDYSDDDQSRSYNSDDQSDYSEHGESAEYERQSTSGRFTIESNIEDYSKNEVPLEDEENYSESYETDTDYDQDGDEHDDIQSTMLSLEDKEKTREEVERIRQNYVKRFGDVDVVPIRTPNRGRSPTPKTTPNSSRHSEDDSAPRNKSTSTKGSRKPEHAQTQTDSIGKEEAMKPEPEKHVVSSTVAAASRQAEKPNVVKSASASNRENARPVQESAPSSPAVPTSPTSKRNGVRSTQKLNKSSGHVSLSRRSLHRKTNTATNPRISWKADPEESFSDWKVKVMYDNGEDNGGMDTYHIHRNVVGYGNRKSLFLLREFRDQIQGVGGEKNSTSHVELSAARAKVFPMVLDFMYYTKEAKQTLTADRACNVFKLAELFEIPALQKAIADFYAKNLSLKNMGDFLMAAGKAKADRLLVVSKAKIGQMITEKPELSGLVPPKFMADILLISRRQLEEARAKDPDTYTEDLVISQSRYWSKAACICAAHNESVLTSKLFQDLTSEESLPHIESSVAPKLLSMDAKFNQKSGDGSLTSLQRRCIESITDDFQLFQKGFSTPEECSKTLKALPADVLAEILMKKMQLS